MAKNRITKRERAMELLLSGETPPEVAHTVGVHRGTVWRWMQEPSFAAEIRNRRVCRRFAILESLQDGAAAAVGSLRSLVVDAAAPPAVRLRAACAILDRAGLPVGGEVPGSYRGLPLLGAEAWQEWEAERIEDEERRRHAVDNLRQVLDNLTSATA